jgi:hypothetical protein
MKVKENAHALLLMPAANGIIVRNDNVPQGATIRVEDVHVFTDPLALYNHLMSHFLGWEDEQPDTTE